MYEFDKNMIPFAITLTFMTVLFIFGMIAFLIIIKTRQNRKSREYMQALIDERERTMYSISLEVHDNVTQMLIMSRMTLRLIEDGSHPEKETAISGVISMLNTLIMDTHNISHALNPEYLKRKGLTASLEEVVKWVNIAREIECDLVIDGEVQRLDEQAEIMAFRVAQEAIQNTIKYAEATKLTIKTSFGESLFKIEIADNGIGFCTDEDCASVGVGLTGMKQRAQIVNGELDVITAPNKGTSVTLKIPIAK